MGDAVNLPGFTEEGLLPPGDYELTLEELAASYLVVGPEGRQNYPNWDASWRARLVENLGVMVRQLWQVGISAIFVDGSFAEDKERPNDIDGYFECELTRLASGELERDLNLLDPAQGLDVGSGKSAVISRLPEEAVADVACLSGRALPALWTALRHSGPIRPRA